MAVKIGPFFSSLPNMARRLALAGVDGLVLFNRFLQPDIDLETLTVTPHLVLSTSDELRLPLRWIAILRGQLEISLAGTTGVHSPEDVVKLLLAGADATMTASSLYKNGPGHVRTLVDGLRSWLEEREYVSVDADEGERQPEQQPGPRGVRTGELHQDADDFPRRGDLGAAATADVSPGPADRPKSWTLHRRDRLD